MGSCAAPSAKGDDKFITTDYLQQCRAESHFRVIWLECKLMLPSRVSRLLSETGFLSVSQLLRDLK
ncbi:MAG: hypothetical protein DI538_30900 [Azospira oryzae]|nr:hypothetical protein [Escherichia coli]PZR19750.1 MAG: hypothetical protein DI538_30900 [Azospira oryzae]